RGCSPCRPSRGRSDSEASGARWAPRDTDPREPLARALRDDRRNDLGKGRRRSQAPLKSARLPAPDPRGAFLMSPYATHLEQQIRSQPEQLERVFTSGSVKAQVHAAAEALHRVRRIWVVGTGTSQHAANLGAAMLQAAGRPAPSRSSMQIVKNSPIVGPQDGVVVITHTGDAAYAL